MRVHVAAAALWLSGCVCLVSVDDGADAGACRVAADCPRVSSCTGDAPFASVATCTQGRCGFAEAVCPEADAGVDGGSDAGVRDGGGCDVAAQCMGQRSTLSFCGSLDAGFSCINHACVWECSAASVGRACTVDLNDCLVCGAQTRCDTNACATSGTVTVAVLAQPECATWPGTTTPFIDAIVTRGASLACHYLATPVTGPGQLGEIHRLSNGDFLAHFSTFGGWCTGRSLATAIPRTLFNCPRCQFVVTGFE